jgi:protein ImuB
VDRSKQQSLLPEMPVGELRSTRARSVRVFSRDTQINKFFISINFIDLSIEVIEISRSCPAAILAEGKRQSRVLICNSIAGLRGIRPGMPARTALLLVPELVIVSRDLRLERQALGRIAHWAVGFTPSVSIDSSGAVLLDVHASLRLFGGLSALLKLIMDGLGRFGYQASVACAPTAQAALWFARCNPKTGQPVIRDAADLRRGLAVLPVSCLGWPADISKLLLGIGVETLGECMRLPRDGLARRMGPGRLRELDNALGLQPEVRPDYQPQKRFREILDLPLETSNCQLLLEALRKLLESLERFLLRHQVAIQVLWIGLRHAHAPAKRLRIGLLQPSMSTNGLLALMGMRLDELQLSEPVGSVILQSDPVDGPAGVRADLFGFRSDTARADAGFLEQLRARLGTQAVYGIRPFPEHRPELAWQALGLGQMERNSDPRESADESKPVRPLWMLPEPLELRVQDGQPVFRSVLDIQTGPERIETGWWDGKDVRRDYYVASNLQGMKLWVFEDRRQSGWYLHGLFG